MSDQSELASGSGESGNNNEKTSEALVSNPYHGYKRSNQSSVRTRNNSLPGFRDLQAASEKDSTHNHENNNSMGRYKKPNEIARIFLEFDGKSIYF